MKKQGTGNREQGTAGKDQGPGNEELGADAIAKAGTIAAKPKASRRKNLVGPEVDGAVPGLTENASPEPVEVDQTRKKARTAKPKTAKVAEKIEEQLLLAIDTPESNEAAAGAESAPAGTTDGAESAGPVADALPVKKAAKPRKKAGKAVKSDKGRDLVTDEPGAREVAEVLEEAAADAAALQAAGEDDDAEATPTAPGPPPKLERLQKILAKAGISSRRKAEELILEGRVQINGKVVSELGTKADMARDHVRVDGKLLQGAERIRYFVLNKPKGFVTTVSDPEGRPTVMQFFASERERLYPVGRLDYLSEGLLLVTNDGDLANKLTKAASGVEKTYLVKVAGQPTEDMLDVLRSGVMIERGKPGTGSGRVRTAPAKIRQVREGDNPWYEVIIIEGRNRELRKMFEEIGHHVEKIRRVGYGPLVLDLEPGKLRELDAEEVHRLHLAAEGKLKGKKKGIPAAAQLPTVAGRTVRHKKADGKPGFVKSGFGKPSLEPRSRAPRPEFQQESPSELPSTRRLPAGGRVSRPDLRMDTRPRPAGGAATRPAFRPDAGRGASSGPQRSGARPEFRARPRTEGRPEGGFAARPGGRSERRPGQGAGFKPGARPGNPGTYDRGGRPAFGGKARRPEPPATDFVLPPRKPLPPDELDERPSRERVGFKPDFKPGFKAGGRPSRGPRDESRPASRPNFRDAYPDPDAGGEGAPRKKIAIEPVAEAPRSGQREGRPTRTGFDKPGGARNTGFAGGATAFRPAGGPGGRRPSSGPAGRSGGEGRPSFRPRTDGLPSGERGYRGPAGERPVRSAGPGGAKPGAGRPFRSGSDRPASERTSSDRGPERGSEFRPRQAGPRPSGSRPTGGSSGSGRPGTGRPATGRPDTARPGTGRSGGPPRFGSRDGAPVRRTEAGQAGSERPREFKPREFKAGGPKKFGAKPGGAGGPGKTGPDGEPRKKERWRNSFTGKNKGRPKPKGKAGE